MTAKKNKPAAADAPEADLSAMSWEDRVVRLEAMLTASESARADLEGRLADALASVQALEGERAARAEADRLAYLDGLQQQALARGGKPLEPEALQAVADLIANDATAAHGKLLGASLLAALPQAAATPASAGRALVAKLGAIPDSLRASAEPTDDEIAAEIRERANAVRPKVAR